MRVAVILTGVLREIDKTQLFFNSLPCNFDLFVVTDKGSKSKLDLLSKVTKSFIIEDDAYQESTQKFVLGMHEGSKILQWHKLSVGINMMENYSREENVKYTNVYKLRSDLHGLNTVNMAEVIESQTIKMDSDLIFGACFKDFISLKDYFLYSLVNYYASGSKLHAFSLSSLSKSEPKAAKFEWLTYPKDLVTGMTNFDFDELLHRINTALPDVDYFKINSKVGHNFRKNHPNIYYPSESLFLTFLLNKFNSVTTIDGSVSLMTGRKMDSVKQMLGGVIDQNSIESNDLVFNNPVMLRDLSLAMQYDNIELSYWLMERAHKIAPDRKFIKIKLNEIRARLNLV